ncbi:coadhesin-like [Physella acuta]|uniref:coadhesin-like n=1 Tax=Physella acuta TaxID=109671 RepID=UPI0027DE1132|nr:coadhesin-like [Physella acuta]
MTDLRIGSTWLMWGAWSPCTAVCDGVKVRSRDCMNPNPEYRGGLCDGSLREAITCGATCSDNMSANGTWSGWQEWTSCSVMCGGGTMLRIRECANHTLEEIAYCIGTSHEHKSCEEICGKSISWGEWGDWTNCRQTNQTERYRRCVVPYPTQETGEPCYGGNREVKGCPHNDTLAYSLLIYLPIAIIISILIITGAVLLITCKVVGFKTR